MFDYKHMKKAALEAQQQTADEPKEAASSLGNQAMLEMLDSRPALSSGGTPLDDAMRARYEQRFGMSMEDVRIHRGSCEPSKYGADAFAFGSDIFLETGKENLLLHQMTHVAQQKKGLVRPTEWVDGMPLNTSPELEGAADGSPFTMEAPAD